MRTNIEIDDELMARAMEAGPFTTKKEAVEAGLRLLRRQAHYREILKWEGKLRWEGDESIDWTSPAEPAGAVEPRPAPPYKAGATAQRAPSRPRGKALAGSGAAGKSGRAGR